MSSETKTEAVRQALKVAAFGEEKPKEGLNLQPDFGPTSRDLVSDYDYKPKNVKVLAKCLRSTMVALGHAHSAFGRFTKLKSRNISPDGKLGGHGYIMEISKMRHSYSSAVESLSSLADTLYDEIQADHWQIVEKQLPEAEQEEIEEIVEDVEDIREDPEGWAEEEELEEELEKEFQKNPSIKNNVSTKPGKKASFDFEKLYFAGEY